MSTTQPFSRNYRVYVEDTDYGQVMYHARFISFMERARSESLIEIGFDLLKLSKQGVYFVIRHIDIDYFRPVLINQTVEVTSEIAKLGNSSMIFAQQIQDPDNSDTVYAKGHVTVVCVDKSGKPQRIPQDMRDAIAEYVI